MFFEKDEINCIYFFKDGEVGYVLPRHQNFVYLELEKGVMFGVSCIVASFIDDGIIKFDIDDWITRTDKLKRMFSIRCQADSQFLTFAIKDFNFLKNDFYEIYTQIFQNSLRDLRKVNKIKVKAIKKCNKNIRRADIMRLTRRIKLNDLQQSEEEDEFYSASLQPSPDPFDLNNNFD